MQAKKDSFENLIKMFSPGVVMIQETKFYKRGTINFENFISFEKVRGQGEGGGLLTLVHKSFDPVMIQTKS